MKTENALLHFYRKDSGKKETCFNIEVSEELTAEELERLKSLLVYRHEQDRLRDKSFLGKGKLSHVGPRLAFPSVSNSNALAILHSIGLTKVTRIEESRRSQNGPVSFDMMTECKYPKILRTFNIRPRIEPVYALPLLEKGIKVLEEFNNKKGLALDEVTRKFLYDYFVSIEGRNPFDVEAYISAFSLSDHSRHLTWNALIELSGKLMPWTLFQIAKAPLLACKGNDRGGFGDNCGIIGGHTVPALVPLHVGRPSVM